MRVEVEVQSVQLPHSSIPGRMVDGVEVACSRCEHVESCFGTTARSVRRCLVLLRENCPQGEENYYHCPDGEDQE